MREWTLSEYTKRCRFFFFFFFQAEDGIRDYKVTGVQTCALPILAHLQSWQGRSEPLADSITAAPVAALSATLDREAPEPADGTALPPLWHWMYFLPHARQSELGPDGHPRRGGFLPPVPLPRRMWAGGRLRWGAGNALPVGPKGPRRSTIRSEAPKR